VINSNFPPILHRFQVMADYWSNFRFSLQRHALAGGDTLRISRWTYLSRN